MAHPIIGILGAGKLGTTLARIGRQAGYPMQIASTHHPDQIRWIIDTVAPGTVTVEAAELVATSDIVILAIPLPHYHQLDPTAFADKVVFDATNYWFETDGTENTISDLTHSSSEVIQAHLAQSQVVKVFNHMGYHDLEIEVDRHPSVKRAMAYATDYDAVRPLVETVVSDFGLAPLDLGPLRFGLLLEPGSPLFGEAIPVSEFKAKLATINQSEFGRKVTEARGQWLA